MSDTVTARARPSAAELLLRVLTAAGLGVSAYVHLHLAHVYSTLGNSITQGDLFYVQGALAAVVGLWVLLTGMRLSWMAAVVIAAASLGAVLLYRYVDVGAIGPIPNMYEPTWQPSPDKALSAVAEGVTMLLAVAGFVGRHRRR